MISESLYITPMLTRYGNVVRQTLTTGNGASLDPLNVAKTETANTSNNTDGGVGVTTDQPGS